MNSNGIREAHTPQAPSPTANCKHLSSCLIGVDPWGGGILWREAKNYWTEEERFYHGLNQHIQRRAVAIFEKRWPLGLEPPPRLVSLATFPSTACLPAPSSARKWYVHLVLPFSFCLDYMRSCWPFCQLDPSLEMGLLIQSLVP